MADIDFIYKTLKEHIRKFDLPIVDKVKEKTNDPYKILVATILSARTQDETTRNASERLFSKANKLEDLDKLSQKEIEKLIYPVGFYRNKARELKKLHNAIKIKFDGRIPDEVEKLIELPGVGRKTANLVVAIAFDKPAICVDTHVHRIMNRLGYVKTKTPFETEMKLRKKLPIKYWTTINSILVSFGQNLCRPINPHCWECPISKECEYYEKVFIKGKTKGIR